LDNNKNSQVALRKCGSVYAIGNRLSSSDFESIIKDYLRGYSYRNIKERKGFSYNTIEKYIHKYENSISIKQNSSKNNGCDSEVVDLIERITKQNPEYTLSSIRTELLNLIGVELSESAISKIRCHKLDFSIQKIDRRCINRLTQRIQDRKRNFIQKVQEINHRDIICIDQAHFTFDSLQGRYACFKKGERPVVENGVHTPKNYTLICAISLVDIAYYEIYDITHNSTKSTHIISFLQNLHNLLPSQYKFLLDNAPVHTAQNITNFINSISRSFIFLPPYHPEFNPIEFYFSELKKKLYGSDINNLVNNLHSLLRFTNECDYQKFFNYYKHCFVTNIEQQ
jgi:transposase